MKNILLAFLLLFSFPAYAGKGIPSPYVTKNKGSIFTDGFYSKGKNLNKLRERITLDYGATDNIGLRLRTIFEDDASNNFDYTSTELSAKFQFTEKDEWFIDVGAFAGVIFVADDAKEHVFSTRFIMAKSIGDWQHKSNIILNNDFGQALDNSKLDLRYASVYKIDKTWQASAEYYGSFNKLNNIHGFSKTKQQAGIVLQYKVPTTSAHMHFGVLWGLNSYTDDVSYKWRLGYSF